jgi:hypothetical protein
MAGPCPAMLQALYKRYTCNRLQGAECCTEQPTADPPFRLLLPAGVDTGPVTVHVLSTQDGWQGVLLGSATTMALPPPAAAELQRAYDRCADSATGTQADQRSAMRELVRDYSMCWSLCKPAPPSGSSAANTEIAQPSQTALDVLLSDVSQFLSYHSLPACHALILYRTSIRHHASRRAGISHSGTSSSSSSSSSGSSSGSSAVLSAYSNPPRGAAGAATARQRHPASGSRRQRFGHHCAQLAAVSKDPHYTAWRQQQGSQMRATDWLLVATMTAMGVWVGGKRLLASLGFGLPWAGWLLAFLALHLGPGLGPHAVLAVAGERLRGRREAVVVAFAVARASSFVAEVLGWLPLPAPLKLLWGVAPTSLVMHGILRPCLQQVCGVRGGLGLWGEVQALKSGVGG